MTSKARLEANIGTLNAKLDTIVQKAQAARMRPFDLDAAVTQLGPSIYGDFTHPEGADFLGFWDECLCTDSLYSAAAELSMPDHLKMPELALVSQRQAAMWLRTWMEDPKRQVQMTKLQRASCAAYERAIYSFTWYENPDLLVEFKDTASELSHDYHRLG